MSLKTADIRLILMLMVLPVSPSIISTDYHAEDGDTAPLPVPGNDDPFQEIPAPDHGFDTEDGSPAASTSNGKDSPGMFEFPPKASNVSSGTRASHVTEGIEEIHSTFQNPAYPMPDTDRTKYKHTILAMKGYCALRIEFLQAELAPRIMGTGCSTDAMVVFNGVDRPSAPFCGLLEGYQMTVKQHPPHPVLIMITARSLSHLWRINLTQIPCINIVPAQTYFSKESKICGVKNPTEVKIRLHHQPPKLIPSHRMLQHEKKNLAYLMAARFLGTIRLLGQTVLEMENIKIQRGTETGVDEYPWQAVLMLNEQVLCGAAVINDEWVVTAGHCVLLNLKEALIRVLTVSVTEHDLRLKDDTNSIIVGVSKIVLHEYGDGEKNDIALIKLDTKLIWWKALKPICLPFDHKENFAGRNGTITGWGKTDDWVISNILREVNAPIITNAKCTLQWVKVLAGGIPSIIDDAMVCAGGQEVGHCTEDPGGPLITEAGKEKRWTLVGVASFGFLKGCAVGGVPVVYTRVTAHLEWMAYNLAPASHPHNGNNATQEAVDG